MTLRISCSLLTLCILSAPCACTPDSKNIGETLSTGEQTGSTTGAQTGTTDAATDGETTVEDVTSASGVDATTAETTAGTTAETASTGDTSTGDASTGDTSTGDASTGDATFPCGMMACDADTQYCSVTIPGIPDAEIMYSCVQIPGRCADEPSCACLNDEQGPCQCAEDQGFTVTCALP